MHDKAERDETEVDELVRASQQGDSEAFGKLYDTFINPLYRYVYYRVGAEEAEDLTELVFLKTWENIRQYRFGKSSFASWLFRIAHNIVIDHYRSKKRPEELSENIQDTRPEADTKSRINGRLNEEIVAGAMKELKDQYRQIIILKYFNDLSNEEISYILDKSQAALRILQFRALKRLKYLLQEKGISEDNL